MDEKKKRLLELYELLRFPMGHDEVEEKVNGLSEDELSSLLKVYESIYEYQSLLDDVAKMVNPEEYKILKEKYNKDILNLELGYTDKLETVQVQTDEEQDLLDEESEKNSDADSTDLKKKFQEIQDTSDDLSLGFKPLSSDK